MTQIPERTIRVGHHAREAAGHDPRPSNLSCRDKLLIGALVAAAIGGALIALVPEDVTVGDTVQATVTTGAVGLLLGLRFCR